MRLVGFQLLRYAPCDWHAAWSKSEVALTAGTGTSLQVQPFASLIGMVGRRVPRVLINREKVGKVRSTVGRRSHAHGMQYNPFMALLGGPTDGFFFDESYNYRDVFQPGDIQEGVLRLAELLGWKQELLALVEEGAREFELSKNAQPTKPQASASSDSKSSDSAGAEPAAVPAQPAQPTSPAAALASPSSPASPVSPVSSLSDVPKGI